MEKIRIWLIFWVGRRTRGTPCVDEGAAAGQCRCSEGHHPGNQHITDGPVTRRDGSSMMGRAKDSWGPSLLPNSVRPSVIRSVASRTPAPHEGVNNHWQERGHRQSSCPNHPWNAPTKLPPPCLPGLKHEPQGSLETIPFFIKHSLQVINITKFFLLILSPKISLLFESVTAEMLSSI